MNNTTLPIYTVLLILMSLALIVMGIDRWQLRHVRLTAQTGAVFLFAVAELLLGNALQIATTNIAAKAFWERVEWIGMAAIPMIWLTLTLQYTGRDKWLTKHTWRLSMIVPCLMLVLIFTSDYHQLFWLADGSNINASGQAFNPPYGVAAWFFLIYGYTIIGVGTFLLIHRLIQSEHLLLWRGSALLVGLVAVFASHILDLIGVYLIAEVELMPLALAVVVPVVALQFERLLYADIMPVTRSAIIEMISDCIIVLDTKNRIIDLNPAGQYLIGRTAATVFGKPIAEIWPAQWPALLPDGQDTPTFTREIELNVRGVERVYDVRTSFLRDRDEHPISQIVVLRDITQRAQAEAALKASEEKYRLHFENVNDVIYTLDGQFHITSVSPSVFRHLGYTPEELLNKSLIEMDVLVPEYYELALANMQKIFAGERIASEEYEFLTKDRQRLVGEVSGAPVFHNGEVVSLISVARDVTERKQIEAALRQSEAQFSQAFHASPAPMVMITPGDWRFLDVNARLLDMTGFTREEVIGRETTDFESLLNAPDFVRQVQSIIALKNLRDMEIQLRTKSGDWRDVLFSAEVIQIGGKPVMLGVLQDITDRKRAEAQVKAALAEKEILLREIHHRVKNNLQIISSLLNLQASTIVDARIEELFRESQNRVRSMALIHEQLYRSDSLSHIDFGEYVRNLANFLLQSYPNPQIDVHLHVQAVEALLDIDTAIPCALIINELVSNALKHAFVGRAAGEVWIELDTLPDACYTLVVRDNGIGFPDAVDFQHTESLGLQLVNSLARQINGSLSLDRTGGTTFRLLFSGPTPKIKKLEAQ